MHPLHKPVRAFMYVAGWLSGAGADRPADRWRYAVDRNPVIAVDAVNGCAMRTETVQWLRFQRTCGTSRASHHDQRPSWSVSSTGRTTTGCFVTFVVSLRRSARICIRRSTVASHAANRA